MDIFVAYIAAFFIVFFLLPLVFIILRFVLWLLLDFCGLGSVQPCNRQRPIHRRRRRVTCGQICDRQGNIFTIADNASPNSGAHRCSDFFYVESNANDAARIRAQLEKDDKDLPTYEEVMGLSTDANRNLTSTLPPPPPGSASIIGASNASVATTDTILAVPPYSEIDTHTIASTPATNATRGATVNTADSAIFTDPVNVLQNSGTVAPLAPSTSRAAASSSSVTLTIPAVASHTSV